MKRLAAVILIIWCLVLSAKAQTSLDELHSNLGLTAGMCCPYIYTPSVMTAAPHGYKPVYISHFGRHGSRYHTWDKLYTSTLEKLQHADSLGVLSPKGKELLVKAALIAEDAAGRIGDLTALGMDEHRSIAERMYQNYRKLLGGKNVHIRAYSTKVHRTILSMTAFVEELSKLNPRIQFDITASDREQAHLNHAPRAKEVHTVFHRELDKFAAEVRPSPERLMRELISDDGFIRENKGWCEGLFSCLIQVATILPAQGNALAEDFMRLFTEEELIKYWEIDNYRLYLECGPSPQYGNMVTADAVPPMEAIISMADEALCSGTPAATLRFGHDLNFVPFITLLGIGGLDKAVSDPRELYKFWSSFKVSPMATNLQMIFYRGPSGNVIVKFLLGEKEMSLSSDNAEVPEGTALDQSHAPYYDWQQVKAYLSDRIDRVLHGTLI